jgi:hypothetical protein
MIVVDRALEGFLPLAVLSAPAMGASCRTLVSKSSSIRQLELRRTS